MLNSVEKILYDVNNLLDNGVYNELYHMVKLQPFDEIRYNEYDKKIFLLYMGFISRKYDMINDTRYYCASDLVIDFELYVKYFDLDNMKLEEIDFIRLKNAVYQRLNMMTDNYNDFYYDKYKFSLMKIRDLLLQMYNKLNK